MVEKIIVSPESIRGLGNIVVPKTGADFEEYNCTMEVSDDTVNGEDVTVYVLTPETTTISLVLSSNVSTVTAGGNVILSVTVTEDEVPVSGQSVSFKLGGTEIGTGTTNSSGVATYTYTTTTGESLNFSADYAGHSSNAVSVVVNKRSTSTSLSLGSASIIVGGSTSASATVTSSGSGVSGLTVTFYDGTTSLGTATTNGSGVATYTLSGLGVGSHSITAVVTATDTYDTSTSSASTLTVLDHSYSLAFSQSSYVATGGSATLECTLLDNNVPVEGATISVSGSDSSLYSGITNNNGVASVTVTNLSSDTTFTASYSNVSDTCTVTVGPSYLFYDACDSADGLSNYGALHKLRVNNVDGTLSYDSGMNAYKVTPTTANADGFCDFPIPALDNKNNYYLEAEIYTTDTSTGGQPGLVLYPSTSTGGEGVFYRDIAQINRCGVLKFANWVENGESGNSQKSSLPVANNWIRVRIEVNGTSVKGIWLKTDGTEVYNHTYTVPYTSSQMRVGICALLKSTTKPYYVRNIKAEAL